MKRAIDVSSWQKTIDWKKVKANGISMAVLREGYRKRIDDYFLNNVQGCKENGIAVIGVYHFVYTDNTDNASLAENAASTVSNMKLAGLDIENTMVFCDVEYDTWNKNGLTCTRQLCSQYIRGYIQELKKLGVKRVGVYANDDYIINYIDKDILTQYPLWLAEYKDSYNKAYNPVLWQFSSKGTVAGISSNVDMNYVLDESIFKTTTEVKTETSKGVTADDVIKIMEGWIGKSRSAGTHHDIIDLYNSHKPLARSYKVTYRDSYCDTGLSSAFLKASQDAGVDVTSVIGGLECGVEEHVKIFKKFGIWDENGSQTPKRGWIIVFNWDTSVQPNDGFSDHIGIVETVEANLIHTIECNTNGGLVARKQYKVGNGFIRGFAKPKYAESSASTLASQNATNATSATTTKKIVATSTSRFAVSKSTIPNRVHQFTGTVTASNLNIRAWAGTEFNFCSFSPLAKGSIVSVKDALQAKDGSTWYYIEYNGKHGFAHSAYIK